MLSYNIRLYCAPADFLPLPQLTGRLVNDSTTTCCAANQPISSCPGPWVRKRRFWGSAEQQETTGVYGYRQTLLDWPSRLQNWFQRMFGFCYGWVCDAGCLRSRSTSAQLFLTVYVNRISYVCSERQRPGRTSAVSSTALRAPHS